MSQPITLYSHASGPNPWKVAILLEELGLPYKTEMMEFPDLKKEAFESKNPNGRVPCIEDPNTGLTLWESGAIIQYLIETYDKNQSLSFTSSPEKYLTQQYLFYQVSGQGPYFGQAAWFSMFHHEKLPSAIERYQNEAKRVTQVLDNVLKKNGDGYLVGGKCTYADLSFVTWGQMLPFLCQGWELEKEVPNYDQWMKGLIERPAVKKVLGDKAKAMEKK